MQYRILAIKLKATENMAVMRAFWLFAFLHNIRFFA